LLHANQKKQNKEGKEERAKQFGIEVVEDSAFAYPSGFPIKLSDYADPVGFDRIQFYRINPLYPKSELSNSIFGLKLVII